MAGDEGQEIISYYTAFSVSYAINRYSTSGP